MKSFLFAFFLNTLIVCSAFSQPGGQGGNNIVSPEVSADGHVIFRLQAPKASSVTVSGDFGPDTKMMKGEK